MFLYPFRTLKRALQMYDEESENLCAEVSDVSKVVQNSFNKSEPAHHVRVNYKQRSFRLRISYTLLIVKAVAWAKE